jgi:hypothetical protein
MHALKVNIFNQTRQVKNPQMMPRVLKVMHNIRLNKFFCCPTQRFCCSYNFVLKVIIIVQWAQCMGKQWMSTAKTKSLRFTTRQTQRRVSISAQE